MYIPKSTVYYTGKKTNYRLIVLIVINNLCTGLIFSSLRSICIDWLTQSWVQLFFGLNCVHYGRQHARYLSSGIITQVPHRTLNTVTHYMLRAMMELTISLSFSRRALTAFLRETFACAMTSSISLDSRLDSSTSSPSSSSSSFLSSVSGALALPRTSSWS